MKGTAPVGDAPASPASRRPLEEYRAAGVRVMLLLGFSSGLPYLLTGDTLSAWMTSAGVDLRKVGLYALVGLPYSLKFLWSPLLDRFRLPLLGRRRGWMLAFQLLLCAGIAAMGSLSFASSLLPIAVAATTVAFLSASQDIVCDAYRTDLLARSERAAGVATFVLGYRLAMVLAGGFALVLAQHTSWRATYFAMAAVMLVGVLTTWRAPEPAASTPPATLRAAVVAPWLDYFRRRGAIAILLFVSLYRIGDTVANLMVTPFLLKHGFDQDTVGVVYKIVGTAATIAGALGGGALVARLGLYRSLVIFGCAQALAGLGYSALALAGTDRALLVLAVAADKLCAGLSIAALEALLMALCNRRYSATQFALLAGASGVAGRLLGSRSGYLVASVGWPLYFVITSAIAVPALGLLGWLKREVVAADEGVDSPARDRSPTGRVLSG